MAERSKPLSTSSSFYRQSPVYMVMSGARRRNDSRLRSPWLKLRASSAALSFRRPSNLSSCRKLRGGCIAELAKRAAGLHDKPHHHQPRSPVLATRCRCLSICVRHPAYSRQPAGCPSDWHHSVVSLETCRARRLAGQVTHLQTGCARPCSTASPTPRRRRRALLAAWWSWLHSPPSRQCHQVQSQTQVGSLASQQMTSLPTAIKCAPWASDD